MRLSHSAREPSSPDPNGCRHQASLDPGRTKHGKRYHIYEARLRSDSGHGDPRHMEVVIAKFPAQGFGTEEWATRILEASQTARDVSVKVNNMFHHVTRLKSSKERQATPERVISFLPTQMNKLNAVATRDKTRRKGEYFVFEDKLPTIQTFMDEEGVVQGTEKAHHKYLHAAVHNAFLHNHGHLVMCNLVGSYNSEEGRYKLCAPTFYSSDKSRGPDDRGLLGMVQVIQNHTCSSLCRHLPKMGDILRQHLTGNGKATHNRN